MNQEEQERLEAELQGLRPNRPPAELMGRLVAGRPALNLQRKANSGSAGRRSWWKYFRRPRLAVSGGDVARLWRWVVPAAGLAVALLLLWRFNPPHNRAAGANPAAAGEASIKADDVRIDQELVSTFDAVAPLPNGEPVRFRCQEWMDNVVLQDSVTGVVIEQRIPRVEVVAAQFDTY
jgi:hypothetical protein